MRVNPWALPRRAARVVHLTDLKEESQLDPNGAPLVFTFHLRGLDIPQLNRVGDRASELWLEWGPESELGFPSPAGAVEISKQLLQTVAALELMQADSDGEPLDSDHADRWSAFDLIGLSVTCPNVWVRLVPTVQELMTPEALSGNALRGAGGSKSAPPSTTTNLTPS